MGTELNTTHGPGRTDQTASDGTQRTNLSASPLLHRLPWLDEGTATLLSALVDDLARRHEDVVAIILFGSIARHEERPLHGSWPSDVDLLVLVDPPQAGAPTRQKRMSLEQRIAIHHTIGEREYHSQTPTRAVQATLAEWDMTDWDTLFVANVARDGALLWARRPLPPALAALTAQGAVFTATLS
ncbi:MAG: nucleotidyltransferase domain-containing protein [Ktedonobacterales bacterium]